MAIIKCRASDEAAKSAIVLDLGDLRAEAERIEREATSRASAILEEARAERERLSEAERVDGFEQGRREGYEAGLSEGRDAGRAESLEQHGERIAALCAGWGEALDEFRSWRHELIGAAQRDVLELALEIATRVTDRAIKLDPAIVQSQLEAALSHTISPTQLVIEINPDDWGLVQDVLPILTAKLAVGAHVEVITSKSLSRGSVRLRSKGGEVDARIETQLARLAQAVIPESDAGEDSDGELRSGAPA